MPQVHHYHFRFSIRGRVDSRVVFATVEIESEAGFDSERARLPDSFAVFHTAEYDCQFDDQVLLPIAQGVVPAKQ